MIRTPEMNELRYRIRLLEQKHGFAVFNSVAAAYETPVAIHFVAFDQNEGTYFTAWINSEDHSPMPDHEGSYDECVQWIEQHYLKYSK